MGMSAVRVITGRTMVAATVLAISCFIITNTLIESRPINIIIEGETPRIVQTPPLYGETEVLTLTITSWIAGLSVMYLYLETFRKPWIISRKQIGNPIVSGQPLKLEELESVSMAMRILREPAKKILEILVKKGGEILQNDLCLETNFSKAKISRTLRELEARNIISRKQYGSTKKIVLSDWMKKERILLTDEAAT
jgi:DNA-binding HxlR family transcriptional regulator